MCRSAVRLDPPIFWDLLVQFGAVWCSFRASLCSSLRTLGALSALVPAGHDGWCRVVDAFPLCSRAWRRAGAELELQLPPELNSQTIDGTRRAAELLQANRAGLLGLQLTGHGRSVHDVLLWRSTGRWAVEGASHHWLPRLSLESRAA